MHNNDKESTRHILQNHEQHLLWEQQQQQQQQQEVIRTPHKLIKHFPQHYFARQQQQQHQSQLQQRHSTGGLIYTQHPSAIAMMTLSANNNNNKRPINYKNRASDGFSMNYVSPVESSGISGGALLTTRQRHQRDLFSGDIQQQPPIIPPAPKNFIMAPMPPKRTHVGNVVHTFETLAAIQQQQQQQQQHQQPPQNRTEQTISKYLKNSTKRLTKFKRKMTSTTNTKKNNTTNFNEAPTINNCDKRKTFNECNKQISQNFLIHHQLELDYRKNLFSTNSTIPLNHSTNNNNKITQLNKTNNKNTSGTFREWVRHSRPYDRDRKDEDEAIIINFDEMLAGYSASDDDDDNHHDDNGCGGGGANNAIVEMGENYGSHVSVINIRGNEVKENNVLRINLIATNDNSRNNNNKNNNNNNINDSKLMTLPATIEQQHRLPIMPKKCTAPAVPPKLRMENVNKSKLTDSQQQREPQRQQQLIPLSTATMKSILNKRAIQNTSVEVTMDIAKPIKNINNNNNNSSNNTCRDNFLHGSTLSQSFVRQKIKKQHAPPPPPPNTTSTTFDNNNIRKTTTIKTTTRLTLSNPWSHVFKPKINHNAKTFANKSQP